MECYFKDIFEKDAATLVLNIADDGTFCKKFKASYPIHQRFHTDESKVDFNEISFYARPGETIDITIKPNVKGQYVCYYNNGSSKDVERWLNSNLNFYEIAFPLHVFKGKVSEMREMAERTWKNMLHRLQVTSQRRYFTPLEMQLALADLQVYFVYGVLNYAEHYETAIMTTEEHNGEYHQVVLDSLELEDLRKIENYLVLHRVDFDNPLLLISMDCYFALNRIQYAKPVMSAYFKQLDDYYAVMREMLGSKDNTLMSQLCVYQKMLTEFKFWQTEKDRILEALKKLPDLSDSQKESALNNIPTIESKYAMVSNTFTHPYVKTKADEFYHRIMAQTDLSTPLPDAPMADLIRSLSAKYPGRILFIDFWGMSCGPCRGAIEDSKNLRAEIAKRNDVKLVFIAGERTTEGSDAYKKYVVEWLADEETVCVTDADFTRLQELFRFNGIPHYETITPDCHRVRDDLRISGYAKFDYELEQLKEKLK